MGRKLTVTKRATYREAVQWIALNDAPGDDGDVKEVQGYISTLLVADLFGADPYKVAIDVVRTRHGVGPFAVKSYSQPTDQPNS